MFDTPVLDLTISIVFVFFLFSIFAAAILEIINTYYKDRALILKDAMDKVFNDPANKNFAVLLYDQALIKSSKRDHQSFPSYISPDNFSQALILTIAEEARDIKIGLDGNGKQVIEKNALPHGEDTFANFKAGLATLNESDLKWMLQSFVQFTSTSDQLQIKIKTWYNDYMDRVSGWFKRKSTRRLLFISIGVSVVFNINFFHLLSSFWQDEDLRNRIVSSAVQTVESGQRPDDATAINMLSPDNDLGVMSQASFDSLKQVMKTRYERADSIYSAIKDSNLPVGWNAKGASWKWQRDPSKNGWLSELQIPRNIWQYLVNLLGLTISAIAISRGAPFWFDALNKLVNLRNSGAKPKS